MTTDEAIALLEDLLVWHEVSPYTETKKGIHLGIEALKYLKTSRDPSGVPEYPLLPGETSESL